MRMSFKLSQRDPDYILQFSKLISIENTFYILHFFYIYIFKKTPLL